MPLHPSERNFLAFLLKHLAAGLLIATIFGIGILVLNIGGIRTMIADGNDGIMPAVMLFAGLYITFGGMSMAIGIMSLGEDKN
jgi:hypothetical protein